jgi:pyruvate dehydrogenase E2 component (dihydrolipoamide acetyltransferase)
MTSTSPAPPAATGTKASSSLRGRTQRMAGLRKIIAQRMVESLQVSAQLTSVVEVDLTEIAEPGIGPRRTSRPARASSFLSSRSS